MRRRRALLAADPEWQEYLKQSPDIIVKMEIAHPDAGAVFAASIIGSRQHLAGQQQEASSKGPNEGNMESVDILIEHGTLLTLKSDRQIITDGAVAIRKDRIVAVGKTAESAAEIHEAKKRSTPRMRLVMPGLVDGHAHLGEIARGLIPDTLRTSDWLKFWCYPYMAAITRGG